MSSKKIFLILAPAMLALLACTVPVRAGEFETASIHLERNVVDEDAEAVIEVQGEDDGLASLLVIAPDGRRIARLESRNRRNLGVREMLLESPEPSLGAVLASYPEGTYRFIARTFDGEELRGEAELSHAFPDPVNITSPAEDATVPAAGLMIQWQPVAGVERYVLELEHEELETALLVDLPASATSFSPPAGWLLPGSEYTLGIGGIGENGNVTVVEIVFHTAR
jgi:hypothetical protein